MSDDNESLPFSEHRQQVEAQLDPATTAVVVVDMINEFLEDGGLMVLASGRRLYRPIQQLVDAAHTAGARVVWLRDQHADESDPEFRKRIVHCLEGSWGTQIVAALHPGPDDIIMPKSTYSGFFRTPLHETLQAHGIRTLIVTGVVTNICVRSTTHDAFFLGYEVLVPEECVSATSDREQESSLYDIDTHYGTVTSLERVLELLVQRQVA
ncbi:MAG TPA: isochorismatase family cysteine hydrolase [Roseiflexaceae bacterium]|nr:isochorismatase family cysteine hydrolase [Roseiflexaceae bacterium]HMP42072.1 isochorismatase family cysteine hydrolase [Roseiflexaceae bacterium]